MMEINKTIRNIPKLTDALCRTSSNEYYFM